MSRKTRTEHMQTLVNFFMDEGKIYTRSEYIRLGDAAPVPYKMLGRYFSGKNYNTVIRMLKRAYPVECSSIGTEPVEVLPPVFAHKQEEPAKELSPLEKLRLASAGESSE